MHPRPDTAGAAAEAQSELARLIDAYLTTQLLYVAAALGVADVLADGPRTGAEIAAAVGADPDVLTRMLRGLALEDVLAEEGDGSFALTPVGEFLREDVPGSLRGLLIVRGQLYWHAAEGLLESARAGGVAFEHVYGEPFFDHLADDAGHEAAFQAAMANRAEREAGSVVAAYDFAGVRRIVDVGGGSGVLLEAILRAMPDLRGVLVDRPEAVEWAGRRLAAAGLGARCECVVGDFFESVPAGADAYLLSRVVHDWADEPALRILRTCAEAMAPGARLLLVEATLPERAQEGPEAVRMDLHMLLLFRARERTEAQYRDLLARAGFRLERVVPTGSPAGLSVFEAVREP